jgi:hypothetical protein
VLDVVFADVFPSAGRIRNSGMATTCAHLSPFQYLVQTERRRPGPDRWDGYSACHQQWITGQEAGLDELVEAAADVLVRLTSDVELKAAEERFMCGHE